MVMVLLMTVDHDLDNVNIRNLFNKHEQWVTKTSTVTQLGKSWRTNNYKDRPDNVDIVIDGHGLQQL